ncbi:MAG: VOC family protein [Rhodospirillaceae bacterium]|jgi:catechol 2,3-dioxygenase-like lactoylglutathione lyase family enzyme|nr:VOC family protein [Rhodospirillaceae bacterium]MBT5944816.1 VOC family protein [Rhodospirillaceae bacterium]MBT6404047.1 VOC family protein [Rhodospirillaceae bacterium]MBT6536481.1 VOC family protein [Rhodospirillaceae bacterium]MBT7362941.1 VOC family protein [Rhodospirillaceae bacterium]
MGNATPPFEMEGLDHLVIRCVDLDAMTHFYCDLLGCTIDRHNKEVDLLQLRAGRQLIDLITVDGVLGRKGGAAPGVEGRNLDHFAIRIDRFDDEALHAYIAENNIEIVEEGPRYGADGTGPSVYLRDPEGNVVELKGPPDPA